MANLACFASDLLPITRASLKPVGQAEAFAIARALAYFRSACWPKPCGLTALLSIIRRHIMRFKRIFGRFGRAEFVNEALPAAIAAYAEDPEFFDQALANILFAAENVKIREISGFFSLTVPKCIRLYGFDIFELRTMKANEFAGSSEQPSLAADSSIRMALELKPKDLGALLAAGDWYKTLDQDSREEIEHLIRENQNPCNLFGKFATERSLDECMTKALMPHAFRSKLQVEADAVEAAQLLDKLALAHGKVQAFREACRKCGSVIGTLISDGVLLDAESHILDYLHTPSKAYSEISRWRIRQALDLACRTMDSEMAAMRETRLRRLIRKPTVSGVLTSAEICLTGREDSGLPRLMPSTVDDRAGVRVRIDGPTARVYDRNGHPLLRRRDTLAVGIRAWPTVMRRKGGLYGLIRCRTDQAGNLVLDAARGKAAQLIDMQGAGLPPKRELVLRLNGSTAEIFTSPGRLTIGREHLRRVMRTERHKRFGANDVIVFQLEDCNIHVETLGCHLREIRLKDMALQLARVMEVLTATYPERRLDEILPETLEIRAMSSYGNRLASTDLNANTDLCLKDMDPAILAAALVHEDAHCLASKTLFSDEKYVAETHRVQRPYFGMKSVLETVQEGITEVFARLVELRFCLDAVRCGTVRPRTLRKMINRTFELTTSDIEHFSSRGLLSAKGLELLRDFQAEAEDLKRSWLKLQTDRRVYPTRPDPKPLAYRIYPEDSTEAKMLFMEGLAEGACHQALKRYGLLPGQTLRSLPGWEMPALPPAAKSLVSRESFREQEPEPDASTQTQAPARDDNSLKFDPEKLSADAREKHEKYLEDWRLKMRDLERNS